MLNAVGCDVAQWTERNVQDELGRDSYLPFVVVQFIFKIQQDDCV